MTVPSRLVLDFDGARVLIDKRTCVSLLRSQEFRGDVKSVGEVLAVPHPHPRCIETDQTPLRHNMSLTLTYKDVEAYLVEIRTERIAVLVDAI